MIEVCGIGTAALDLLTGTLYSMMAIIVIKPHRNVWNYTPNITIASSAMNTV